MKLLKILLGIFASLILLVVLGLAVIVFLVDPNDYKQKLEELAAEQKTELKIDGDLGWSFYPQLGIRSGKFSVKPPMESLASPAQFDRMTLAVKLMPLFKRQVMVDSVNFEGGQVTLQDATTQKATTISNLSLQVADLNLQQNPFVIFLSLDMQAADGAQILQTINLKTDATITLDKAMQKITIGKSHHAVQFTGVAIGGKTANITADFSAQIDLAKKTASLPDLKMQIDSTHINGRVDSDFSETPFVKATLAGDTINLDNYLVKKSSEKPVEAPVAEDANAELIPAETIKALPGDYVFSFQNVTSNNIAISDFILDLSISQDGIVTIKKLKTHLYDGDFNLDGKIDLRTAQPTVQMNIALTPIQIEPAMMAFMKTEKAAVAGDFGFNAAISTAGVTKNQLMQSLDGKVSFSSKSITLNEVDLTSSLDSSLLQLLQIKLPEILSQKNQTVMTDLTGDAVIQNGKIDNTSLIAKSLCTQFSGKGTYHLSTTAIDYKMGIIFPASDTNKTCTEINPRLKDIAWPVVCKGTLADEPSKLCGVDQAAIQSILAKSVKKEVNQKLENELDKQLKKKLGENGDQVKQLLKGFF